MNTRLLNRSWNGFNGVRFKRSWAAIAPGLTLTGLLLLGCTPTSERSAPQQRTQPDAVQVTDSTPVIDSTQDTDPTQVTRSTQETTADPIAESFFVDNGVALRGADPVAYFIQNEYVPGSENYTHSWGGATWQFVSAENRDRFARNPETYAPQYGGYCAWAVSQGYTAPIDPSAWKIVSGKLYLNYDRAVQKKWEQDIPGHIARADQNWPAVLNP